MRVGPSKAYKMPLILKGDHPHACGDKAMADIISYGSLGSSPCVWGQATLRRVACKAFRIIPMRVGTRFWFGNQKSQAQDHPHACGDKAYFSDFQRFLLGSSPCVWGQGTTFPLEGISVRIIPMRVGTRQVLLSFIGDA